MINNRNLSMLMDLYELTMSNGYLDCGHGVDVVVFDMFFRRVPDQGGFAIFAGLEQFIEYLKNLKFTTDDIAYLRSLSLFSDKFLEYLSDFKFSCTVYSVEEGTPIFRNEPIITVIGPVIEAQLIETFLLCTINHQSLIATKANRIVRAADGRGVMEFGARRAQGYDAANYGSRAAYIAGCNATSNVMAGYMFNIPVSGTMAHSWVQLFDSEYEAFATYAKKYPENCTLLVDTYSTLNSGIPNAIKVFDEILTPLGHRPSGVRIDSGDIAYLSKKARKMLDDAGYSDVKIIASNSINEYIIRDLAIQNAAVDGYGIGEKLITAKSDPVFGGVYKLVAIKKDNEFVPRIKLSESVEKMTVPHLKTLYRVYDNDTGFAEADLICMYDEKPDETKPLTLFDPVDTWKKTTYKNYRLERLQKLIFDRGELVYKTPDIKDIRKHCLDSVAALWDEVTRMENPHKYYVDLSKKLWDARYNLLTEVQNEFE